MSDEENVDTNVSNGNESPPNGNESPNVPQNDAPKGDESNGTDNGTEDEDEDEGEETAELVARNAALLEKYGSETFDVTLTLRKVMYANVRGRKVARDMTALPLNAHLHLYGYGFQRVNNDAGAISREKDPKTKQYTETMEAFELRAAEESLSQSDKKWTALESGNIRVQSARETDPVAARAMEMALADVTTAIRAALKLSETDKLPKEIDRKLLREKARDVVDSDPQYMESARRQIEEAKKVKGVKIDLSDLLAKTAKPVETAKEPIPDEPKDGDEPKTETPQG